MPDVTACPDCGCELPEQSLGGLCPNCLFGEALSESQADDPRLAVTTPGNAPVAAPSPDELAPLFPQIELLELIGQGGMGAVYKARQPKLDRLVALKIVRPESADDPAFAERFTREARTLARLSHPNIVAVHDFGEVHNEQGQPVYYFVMEYVDGVNLRQLIATKTIPSAQALSIVPRLCDALHYAHAEGIVHRDIKPENILIDRRGRVKIADFGLAKLAAAEQQLTLTGTHQVMGTPRYMAPEQMEGSRAVDHRADIYSLGVVFYEMLTGEVPMGQFVPPSQKTPLDVRLDDIVLRAMAREPERRFQDAGEMQSSLAAISAVSRAASPEAIDHWAGPSTILEHGVERVLDEVQTGGILRLLRHPLTTGIVGMLLCIAGIAAVFAPWSRFTDALMSGVDDDPGIWVCVSYGLLALSLLAGGTSGQRPTWRPWAFFGSAAIALMALAMFRSNAYRPTDFVSLEIGFSTSVALATALLVTGAWDLRCLVSDPQRSAPEEGGARRNLAETAQFGFIVPERSMLAAEVSAHFSRLGYRQVESQSDEWVFQRGSNSGIWWADIRQAFMQVTIRTGPQPGGGHWISCSWSVPNSGAWLVDEQRHRQLLQSEAEDLQRALGGEPGAAGDEFGSGAAQPLPAVERVVSPGGSAADSQSGLRHAVQSEGSAIKEWVTGSADQQRLSVPAASFAFAGIVGCLSVFLPWVWVTTQSSPVTTRLFSGYDRWPGLVALGCFAAIVLLVLITPGRRRLSVGWMLSVAILSLGVLTQIGIYLGKEVGDSQWPQKKESRAVAMGTGGGAGSSAAVEDVGSETTDLYKIPHQRIYRSGVLLAGSSAVLLLVLSGIGIRHAVSRPRPAREQIAAVPAGTRPRWSRKAIIGACWIPAFFIAVGGFVIPATTIRVAPEADAAPASWSLVVLILVFSVGGLGALAPFTSTILGCMALGDIRDSRGTLRGRGLAYVVAIFFPLLILDVILLTTAGLVSAWLFERSMIAVLLMIPVVLIVDGVLAWVGWRRMTNAVSPE